MSTYTVRPGESIGDVVMNSTGDITNWDAILTANGFTDWVPVLAAGQIVQIPDSLVNVDANVVRQLSFYPACNNFINKWLSLINAVFGIISDNWILKTGAWRDLGIWIDTDFWID